MKIQEYAAIKRIAEIRKPYFHYLSKIAPKGRNLGYSFHLLTQMLIEDFPELTELMASKMVNKYFKWEMSIV